MRGNDAAVAVAVVVAKRRREARENASRDASVDQLEFDEAIFSSP
jgi:hypothetical protein